MNYLDRNKALINEIRQNSQLSIGREIGKSETGMKVYTLGNYSSQALGSDLYLALKVKARTKSLLDFTVAADLGLIRVIESRFPHLLREFPQVYGRLLDPKGESLGIITEDFSRGGRYEVYPECSNLPRELADAFGHHIEDDDLATTCFNVNNERRIGDFGEFTMGFRIGTWDKITPLRDILDKIEEVTVQLRQ